MLFSELYNFQFVLVLLKFVLSRYIFRNEALISIIFVTYFLAL